MRKLLIIIALFSSAALFAQEVEKCKTDSSKIEEYKQEGYRKKTDKNWSFYGNFGIGYSTPVTLEGLTISDDDLQYFKSRGIVPNFTTSGRAKVVPTFKLGASYYFNMFRVSLDMGSKYVNQTNYHAYNFNLDALFGVSLLGGNHELNFDLGLGYYALWNDYYYNWTGVDCRGNLLYQNGVPEQRSVYLGNHNTHTLSIPAKISYLYNIAGKHWAGAFVHGRVNVASNAFCPRLGVSGGVEYRYTLGNYNKTKKARVKKEKVVAVPVTYVESQPKAKIVSQPVQQIVAQSEVQAVAIPGSSTYTPIYIVVSPGSSFSVETSEGVKISGDGSGAVTEGAPVQTQSIEAVVNDADNDLTRILFEINSAVVTQTSMEIMNNLNLQGVKTIDLTASTCSIGSTEANIKLGKQRLESIKKYLRGRGYTGYFIESYAPNEYPDPDWRSVFLKVLK